MSNNEFPEKEYQERYRAVLGDLFREVVFKWLMKEISIPNCLVPGDLNHMCMEMSTRSNMVSVEKRIVKQKGSRSFKLDLTNLVLIKFCPAFD